MKKNRPGQRENSLARRIQQLRRLYERLPQINCRGLCQECCGPISPAPAELLLLEGRAGVLPKPAGMLGEGGKQLMREETLPEDHFPILYDLQTQRCPLLSPRGVCTQYAFRPLICRLWGVVPDMVCPHGCVIDGEPLTPAEAQALLAECWKI